MLKSCFSTAAIALSLSLSPAIVFAQPEPEPQTTEISATKLALIDELWVVTKGDENATQVLDLMMSQMQDQAKVMSESLFGEDASPEISAVFDQTFTRITDRMYTLMQEKIDFVAVQKDINLKLYDEYFSEAELQDLVDFYQTPTGQKTATILPQLTQRSMELFGQQVTPTMIEIQQQVFQEEFTFDLGTFEEDESALKNEAQAENRSEAPNYGAPIDSGNVGGVGVR